MGSIYNKSDVEAILARIDNLKPDLKPRWGKMKAAQMLAHCSSFHDIATGNSRPRSSWIGIFVGNFAKPIFYNEKPLPHNMSTIPTIMISDERDFEWEKDILKQKIIAIQKTRMKITNPHPFFGKLTSEQWSTGLYKHLDHHLQQFGV